MARTDLDNAATIGTTEFSLPNNSTTLTPITTACTMQAWIDLSNLASGDQFQVHVNEKVNAGTQRTVYEAVVTGAQNPPMFVLPALIVGGGWDVTIKKLAGTDRSISWSVRQIS